VTGQQAEKGLHSLKRLSLRKCGGFKRKQSNGDTHTCNPSTQEAEAGSQAPGQPRLRSETLVSKIKIKDKEKKRAQHLRSLLKAVCKAMQCKRDGHTEQTLKKKTKWYSKKQKHPTVEGSSQKRRKPKMVAQG
jgi:hypothetical protein